MIPFVFLNLIYYSAEELELRAFLTACEVGYVPMEFFKGWK
jgi:hypothetical protein